MPAGFATESVLSLSAPSAATAPYAGAVAAAFMAWGDLLLARAGGHRTAADATPWIAQLGYSFTGACEPARFELPIS